MLKQRKIGIIGIIIIMLLIQIGNRLVYAEDNIYQDQIPEMEYIVGPFSTEEELEDLKEQRYIDSFSTFFSNESIPETIYWQEVERILYEKMKNREEKIRINYIGGDTSDQMKKIKECIDKVFNNDHYIYYNYAGMSYGYGGYINDGIQIKIDIKYRTTKTEEEFVDRKVKNILSEIIKPSMSDREKVKAVHDYIVLNTEYDLSYSNYTAYEALNEGKTVCNGYSLLGHRMLNEIGIPTRILSSKDMNHAWNLVKLGGQWYHMDITWDDPVPDIKGRVLYNYYLLTDTEMRIDHSWEDEEYPLSGEGIVLNEFSPITVTGISLDKTNLKFSELGQGGKITATVKPTNAWNKNVIWNSNDENVVRVNEDGELDIVGNGSAIITATTIDGGYKGTCKVIVKEGQEQIDIGWVKIGPEWYYLNSSGTMATGWTKVGSKWYYMDSSGVMQNGWKLLGGKWYYLNSSGAMATGWTKVGSKWYYFYSDGSMASNITIGKHKLGENGAML